MKLRIIELTAKIEIKAKVFWQKTRDLGKTFKREADETKVAVKILKKIIRKEEVSPEQIQFLKSQSVDLGKAMAIVGLQAIPGSSLALLGLEKIGQKHGFTLFPKDQVEPDMKPLASDTPEAETFD